MHKVAYILYHLYIVWIIIYSGALNVQLFINLWWFITEHLLPKWSYQIVIFQNIETIKLTTLLQNEQLTSLFDKLKGAFWFEVKC